jgi:hypothetical protein
MFTSITPPARKLVGNRCRCSACGEYFNHPSTFTKHRTGKYDPDTRRCLTVEEMTAKGWQLNPAAYWITATMPADRRTRPATHLAALAAPPDARPLPHVLAI